MFSILIISLVFTDKESSTVRSTVRSTKEPLNALTSRRLPQLMLVTYYYYYTAWCLIKKNHGEALAWEDGEKNWVRGERVTVDVPRKRSKMENKRRGVGVKAGRSGQHCGDTARSYFWKTWPVYPHLTWNMHNCSHVRMQPLTCSYERKKRIIPEKERVVYSWGCAVLHHAAL